MQGLENRRIVLTGAAGGIGSLVTKRLAAQGAIVTGVDRSECKGCNDSITADLSTMEGLEKLSTQLAERDVDILVNLAGIQYFGPFRQQEASNIWLGYIVNLVAPAILARAVLPQMTARGSGQIVNIGSVFGSIPFAHFVTYSSSKAGLKGLSQALRRELKGSGVTVTHIAPRAVKTALNSSKVMEFAQATKMNMDAPELVADRIVEAIAGARKDVVIGFPESFFVRVNALLPSVVDRALAANDQKAAALFK